MEQTRPVQKSRHTAIIPSAARFSLTGAKEFYVTDPGRRHLSRLLRNASASLFFSLPLLLFFLVFSLRDSFRIDSEQSFQG